jgi:hypothetical protein
MASTTINSTKLKPLRRRARCTLQLGSLCIVVSLSLFFVPSILSGLSTLGKRAKAGLNRGTSITVKDKVVVARGGF